MRLDKIKPFKKERNQIISFKISEEKLPRTINMTLGKSSGK